MLMLAQLQGPIAREENNRVMHDGQRATMKMAKRHRESTGYYGMEGDHRTYNIHLKKASP